MSNSKEKITFNTGKKVINASEKLRSKGFTHQEIYLAGLEIINTMIDPETKPSETKKIADMLTKTKDR